MGQNERHIDDEQSRDLTSLQIDAIQVEINDKMKTNVKQVSITSEEKPICRICHCSNDDIDIGQSKKKWISNKYSGNNKFNINDPFFLITPCYCTGTLQYVHHKCLQQWIRSSNHKYCELCKYSFKLKTKNKPFYQWEFINMSEGERRKFLFRLSFNLVSMICVFWSIYVIGERASLEFSNRIGWRFWIKIFVITIGLICGIIFIFFQLKLYVSILTRWKQYNQIIIIENVCKESILNVKNDGQNHKVSENNGESNK